MSFPHRFCPVLLKPFNLGRPIRTRLSSLGRPTPVNEKDRESVRDRTRKNTQQPKNCLFPLKTPALLSGITARRHRQRGAKWTSRKRDIFVELTLSGFVAVGVVVLSHVPLYHGHANNKITTMFLRRPAAYCVMMCACRVG